jgi:hypothetical protein
MDYIRYGRYFRRSLACIGSGCSACLGEVAAPGVMQVGAEVALADLLPDPHVTRPHLVRLEPPGQTASVQWLAAQIAPG